MGISKASGLVVVCQQGVLTVNCKSTARGLQMRMQMPVYLLGDLESGGMQALTSFIGVHTPQARLTKVNAE